MGAISVFLFLERKPNLPLDFSSESLYSFFGLSPLRLEVSRIIAITSRSIIIIIISKNTQPDILKISPIGTAEQNTLPKLPIVLVNAAGSRLKSDEEFGCATGMSHSELSW